MWKIDIWKNNKVNSSSEIKITTPQAKEKMKRKSIKICFNESILIEEQQLSKKMKLKFWNIRS